MRVILEIVSGTEKGRRKGLSENQSIVVGRTEWADFVVPTDPRISGRHFSLANDYDTSRLADLGSINGTYVNGKKVSQVVLRDGDQVVAGDTHFVIRIGAPINGGTIHDVPFVMPRQNTADRDESLPSPEIRIGITQSGLHYAQCTTEQLPARELLERIGQQCATYLIVDFKRLGAALPPELAEPAYLFNWLPEAACSASPVVVDVREWPASIELFNSAWGKDALICLGSQLAPSRLTEHLRSRVHARRDSVLGICWPAVLSAVLLNCAPELVKHLLIGIEWVLTENPDDPNQWQFFSGADLHVFFNHLDLPVTIVPAAAS